MIDRTSWRMERMRGLGGSDMGAILGLSPYRTPVDVWMEKTGRTMQQEETLQMRFGTYAEEFVAKEYSQQTGQGVQRFTTMLHHPTAPILGNIDRLVIPAGQKRASHQSEIRTDRLLECKTASVFAAYKPEEWGVAGSDQVPMSYLVQCATYRILTGCTYADLAVLFGNQEVRIYELPSDADLEQMIIAKASEWWKAHVLADVAPPPICDADVRALYPASRQGSIVEANEAVLHELAILRETRASIATLQKVADDAALSIKSAMGEGEILTLNGETLATWRSAKPTKKTDWQAVCNELAAPASMIDEFTTETPGSRRFILKDEK